MTSPPPQRNAEPAAAEVGGTSHASAAPKSVLVTGGCGFIGSHLVDALLAAGDRVTVVDSLETSSRANLPALSAAPGLRFIHATLAQTLASGQLDDTPFDEVYHLAAAVGVRRIMQQQVRSIRVNVEDTSALLHWCAARPTPPAILITSSSEVYGKSPKSPFSEDDDVLYGNSTVHRWSYAASKAVDEFLALAWHREAGLNTVVARLFNTVGPRQVGSYGMVLPTFVARALAGQDLQVHGDGRQTRCFCDVRDVRDALIALLRRGNCFGRVFNVGNDRPLSMLELAQRVIHSVHSHSSVSLLPYDQVYGTGFEDLRQRQPDLTRIRQAIGWNPSRALETTILDVAAWMQAAPISPTQTPAPAQAHAQPAEQSEAYPLPSPPQHPLGAPSRPTALPKLSKESLA